MKTCVPLPNWCFFKIKFLKCFRLRRVFLQCFLLIDLVMGFLDPLLDLPILQKFTKSSFDSALTLSARINVSVHSVLEFCSKCRMPEITKLFLQPYCFKAYWENSITATLFSNSWHLFRSFHFFFLLVV